jgi:hypothetical protein
MNADKRRYDYFAFFAPFAVFLLFDSTLQLTLHLISGWNGIKVVVFGSASVWLIYFPGKNQ